MAALDILKRAGNLILYLFILSVVISIYIKIENSDYKKMMITVMSITILYLIINIIFMTPFGQKLDLIPSFGIMASIANFFNLLFMVFCAIAVGIVSESMTDDKLKNTSYAVIIIFSLFGLKSYSDMYLAYNGESCDYYG